MHDPQQNLSRSASVTSMPKVGAQLGMQLLGVILLATGLASMATDARAEGLRREFFPTQSGEPAVVNHQLPYHDIRRYGIDSTGATDDSLLVQTVLNSLPAGSKLHIPAGNYVWGDVYLPSNVEIFGDGDATVITASSPRANIFFNNGLYPGFYNDYTYHGLSNIVAGDKTLTFVVAEEAANYTAGDLAFIHTNLVPASGGFIPTFCEVVKIVSVDLVAGTVTLEHAIDETVLDPKIARPIRKNHSTEVATPDRFIENTTLRDMKLVGSATGAGFRMRTVYKCVFRNLTVDNMHMIIGNAWTRTLIENIRGKFGAGGRVIELKTGAYKTVVRNIVATTDANTTALPSIDIGEYARNITCDGVDVVCPGVTNTGANGWIALPVSAGRGHKIKNINVSAGDSYSAIRIANGDAHFDNANIELHDIRFKLKSVARPLMLVQGATGTPVMNRLRLHRILVDAPVVNNINDDTAFGYYLDHSSRESSIQECYVNGKIFLNTSRSTDGFEFIGNRHSGLGPNITHESMAGITFRDNQRLGSEEFGKRRISRRSLAIDSTAVDNSVDSYAIPPGELWESGDLVHFEIVGQIAGNTGTKEIRVVGPNTSNVMALSFSAKDSGVFKIVGTIYIMDNTTYHSVVKFFAPGSDNAKLTQVGGLDFFANGGTFDFQAWVANAEDSVQISSLQVYPELNGG